MVQKPVKFVSKNVADRRACARDSAILIFFDRTPNSSRRQLSDTLTIDLTTNSNNLTVNRLAASWSNIEVEVVDDRTEMAIFLDDLKAIVPKFSCQR
jgi:hypothetical protein